MRAWNHDWPSCRSSTISLRVLPAPCRRSRVPEARTSVVEQPIGSEARSRVAACWMGSRVCAQVGRGLAQLPVFPRLSQAERDKRIQAWARGMLKQFGVELELVGNPPRKGPMLLVSNHVSWLDIPAVHAVCH